MSTKVNIAAVAAAMAVLVTPMLTSAMSAAKLPRGAQASAVAFPSTPAVVSPDGRRVLGTDPSLAVRFELRRDYGRGR